MKITIKEIKKMINNSLKEVGMTQAPYLPLPPYLDKGGTMIGKIRLVTSGVTTERAQNVWMIAMDALKILKAQKPYWDFTESYIKRIEISSTTNTGMDVKNRTFYINQDYATTDPNWLASSIFHDSIHVWQYETGKGVYPNKGVRGAWLDPRGRIELPPKMVHDNWGKFRKFDFESYCNDKQVGFLQTIGATSWVNHLKGIIQQGSHYANYADNPYE